MHLIAFQVVSKVTTHIVNQKKFDTLKCLLTNQTAFKQEGTSQILATHRNQPHLKPVSVQAIAHMCEKSYY